MEICKISSYLRVGLLLDYYSPHTVITWADKMIGSGVNDERLIDISLSENKSIKEIVSLLGLWDEDSLTTSFENEIDNYYMSFLYFSLKGNIDSWLKIEKEVVRFFYLGRMNMTDEVRLFASILIEDFSLREDGFGGSMAMPSEMFEFLRGFEKHFSVLQDMLKQNGLPDPDIKI